MSGTMVSPGSGAFLRRDAERQRLLSQRVQERDQVGKFMITAANVQEETIFQVQFNYTFIELPIFTFGSHLDEYNAAPAPGAFPTCSATVHQFLYESNGPMKGYTGAVIGAVTTGAVGQNLWVHYRFSGRCLSFPAPGFANGGTTLA